MNSPWSLLNDPKSKGLSSLPLKHGFIDRLIHTGCWSSTRHNQNGGSNEYPWGGERRSICGIHLSGVAAPATEGKGRARVTWKRQHIRFWGTSFVRHVSVSMEVRVQSVWRLAWGEGTRSLLAQSRLIAMSHSAFVSVAWWRRAFVDTDQSRDAAEHLPVS